MIQQKDVDLPFPVVSTSIVPLLMDDERCNLRRSCPYPQVSKSFRRVGVSDLDMTSCAMWSMTANRIQLRLFLLATTFILWRSAITIHMKISYVVTAEGFTANEDWRWVIYLYIINTLYSSPLLKGISPSNQSHFLASLSRIRQSLHDVDVVVTRDDTECMPYHGTMPKLSRLHGQARSLLQH